MRESGTIGKRFGAAEHLVLAFDFDPTEACRVHAAWMESYASGEMSLNDGG
jgi:hypothetical protein